MRFIALLVILFIAAAYCDSSSSDSGSDSGSGSSEKSHKHLRKNKSKNDCGRGNECDDPLSSSEDVPSKHYKNKYDYNVRKRNKFDSEENHRHKYKSGRKNKNSSGSDSSDNSGSKSSEESNKKSRRRNKNSGDSDESNEKSRRRNKNSSGSDSSDESGSNSSSGHKRRKHKGRKSSSDSYESGGKRYYKGTKRPNEHKTYKPKELVSVSSSEENFPKHKKYPEDPIFEESDEINGTPPKGDGRKRPNEHKTYKPKDLVSVSSSEKNFPKNKKYPVDPIFDEVNGTPTKGMKIPSQPTVQSITTTKEDLISEEDDEPKIPEKNVFSSISSEEDNDQCLTETITTKDGTKIQFPNANSGAVFRENQIKDISFQGYQIKEILSDPICLDEYNFPITRKCIYDVWENITTPECFSYRPKHSNSCPPGFNHFNLKEKSYCFKFLPSQKWNNTCMQFGDTIMDFDLFGKESFFNHHKLKKFWIPGKRDGSKDLFISKTLNSFGDQININHLTINGDCLVFDYKLGKVISEDCDKKYPMICLQDHTNNQLIKLACPDGFQTTTLIGYQNKCFKVSSEVNNYNILEVTSPEKQYILKSIIETKRDLKIAINILTNNPMAKPQIFEANTNLTFSNWIQRYKFDDVEKFVVTEFKEDGWFLSNKFDSIAYEVELNLQKPEMYLNFQIEKKSLLLTVYSGNFLWKSNDDETGFQCFTNSDGNIIKKVRINTKSIVKDQFRTISIYEVDLIHKNPGQYWCHGHSISNFEFIQTDKIIANRDPDDLIFVALIEIKCGICTQVTQNHFINNITNSIQSIIDKTVRIMKIDSINFEESTVRYVLHITTSHHDLTTKEINHAYKKGISLKTYEIYLLRKSLLKKLNKLTNYRLYSLTSSNWCFSEEEKYNVIETIDEDSKSQEICKSSFYSQMKECINDFIYGGIWKDIVCSLKKKDITQELNGLKISYFHASHKIRKLLEIISEDVKIKSTDLYIIADILKSINITDLKLTDIKNVVKIVNEFMLIKRLEDVKYNTTNNILDTFDKIVNELDTYHMKTPKVEVFTINENSGVLGVAIFKNTSKEIFNNDFNDYYFEYLYSNEQTELLLLQDNLEVAAIIPSDLLTIMNANNKISTAPLKIVISLFYDDLLFQTLQKVEETKSSGIVLKLSIHGYDSDSIKELHQRISVYFKMKNDLDNKKVACGFWNSEQWSRDELIYVSDKKVAKCEYSVIKYFSLVSTEQVLQYDVRRNSTADKINKINEIVE